MWKKLLAITFLFYIFALLQNSFLTHFNLFGAIPNLVFILFFSLVFFDKKDNNYQVILYAVLAGIFLDVFSYTYLGPSIIILLIIGFLLKGIQMSLKSTEDKHPFVYFLPLFLIFLLAYNFLLGLYLYLLDPNKIILAFGITTIFLLIYNLFIASIFFYIHKKFNGKKI